MHEKKPKDVITLQIPVNVNFAASLGVGLFSGVGFHPIDRALYLRGVEKLKDRAHLFAPKYWAAPMSGLRNTIYQRIVSNAIYFTMQGELNSRLYPVIKNEWQWREGFAKSFIGLIAGSVTGLFSNANYAVKFYTFTYRPNGKPLENACEMFKKGGLKPFFKGIYAGVARDSIFGVSYEASNSLIDQYLVPKLQAKVSDDSHKTRDAIYLLSRFFTAAIAITLSSPLNYARNMQFQTPPQKKQPLTIDLWCDAWRESNKAIVMAKKNAPQQSYLESVFSFPRVSFFKKKFMIEAGTVRAAFGFALSQFLFNKLVELIRQLDNQNDEKPQSTLRS